MIEGRVVAGYLRLASLGRGADQRGEVDALLARLRTLVLARVGPAALAAVDDRHTDADALATVASAIEEAGRRDHEFAAQVTGLCEEIARWGVKPALWPGAPVVCPRCGHHVHPDHAFCDQCGSFLEWASEAAAAPSPEAPRGPSTAPVVAPPATRGIDSEPAAAPPPEPAAEPRRRRPRRRTGRGRLDLTIDRSAKLEVSGATESSRQRAQATIDDALSTYVQSGRLLFDPPAQMRQGRAERVKVAISQHGGLDAQLRALAGGPEDAVIDEVETTPFMEVDLQGSAFSIVSLQAGGAAEQLLRPTALWQFDVTPERGGSHPLQLRVAMRIPLSDREERVSLPVLERTVQVEVDAAWSGRRFVRAHWQWVAATLAGLGGAIGAWIKLFQD